MHGGANLLEQCRHVEFRGLADAAAQHDDAVQHAGRLRDGIARRLAETGESFHGGLLVAVKRAVGNAIDVVGVCIFSGFCILREFAVVAQHRTEGNAFLGDELLPPLAGSAVNLGAAVVTHKHLVVGSYADTKSCPEDETDEVVVLFHAARIADFFVQHRQCACQSLAVGEQVGIVVDEDGQPELIFQKGTQSDSPFETGEVGEPVGKHAVGIVRGSRKGEADGDGLVGKLVDDVLESVAEVFQQLRQIVGMGGQFKSLGYRLTAPHRRKTEMRAAGV